MITRSFAAAALTALVAIPSIAGAQMSTPKPAMMGSPSAMGTPKPTSFKKSLKKSTKTTPPMPSSTTHAMKSGPAQSTDPGAPNYSGSSGTGH